MRPEKNGIKWLELLCPVKELESVRVSHNLTGVSVVSPPFLQIVRALEHLHSKLSVIHRGKVQIADPIRLTEKAAES